MFGYIPDRADHGLKSWSNSPIARAAARVPRVVSMRDHSPPVFEQGYVGSCIGHGTSTALVQVCRANGIPLGFIPSPDGIYKVARIYGRSRHVVAGKPLYPLTDSGAMPCDALDGMREIGIRQMGELVEGRSSDCSLASCLLEPEIGEFLLDAAHLVIGPYRVGLAGAALVDALQTSMARGCAVATGIWVDDAFQSWDPSNGPLDGIPDRNDPNGGGHWIDVETIETLASGERVLTLLNSWGDWGDEGRIRVTERWFTASLSDPTVFADTTKFVEAA